MAQPAMKEKPKTQQQLGLEAAQHYADFIRTGKEESRQKFLDIYQANQNNDVFFNSFAERLKKNHAPLIQAYARNNEDADPLKVLDSIAAFHREFQKPEEERNMNIVRVTYGSDFVSEMEKAIQQPEQAVRPPETKPAEPEPAEARPAEPEPAEARPAEPEPVPKTRETQQPKKAEVQAGLAETAVDYLKHFITTGDAKSKAEFLRIWRENQKDDTFYAAVVELVRQNPQVFKKLIMSYYEHNDRVHPKMSEEDKLPTPEKLVAAVSEFYAELRKPTDKQNISKLSSKYGADFVKEMERIQQKHVVPVRVPSVDEISIDYLIHTFSVKLPPNASKQQKMEGLVKSIGTWFQISDRREANELTTTLLRAYSIMDKKERQSFSSWLIMMDPAQRKSLADQVRVKASARTLSVPYEFVKSEYLSWFENQKNKSEEISDIERNIRGFPSYVKEGTLEQFARQFEKDPSQYNFGLIGKRIEYLELKIQSAHLRGKSGEAETYEKEKKQLLSWFESIGIKAEDVTSAIIEMNAGLFTIQELYYSLDPESPGLMEYLAGIKPKPKLFMIYKKRLSEIDARSGKIFVGVQVKDPDYLTKIAERAGTRLTPARVQKGQGTWHEEYYKPNSPSQSDVDRNPAEAQMYDRIASLSPMAALAFLEYLEQATDGELRSEAERKLVVRTVSRLAAISPRTGAQSFAMSGLLIVRYFAAVRNLAYICEDNQEVFMQAMVSLSGRIEAETEAIVSGVSPAGVQPLNIISLVNNLDRSLGEISMIEKSSIAQYDRLNLMDDALYLRLQQPPHHITQKPPDYAPRLLVPRERPRVYTPPYFLPNRIQTTTPVSPFTAGGLYTQVPQYGGNLQLPQFRQYQVTPGTDAVGSSFEFYLDPQHPVVNISSYLPGTTISGLSGTKLLNEIARAFIPTERPDYSSELVAAGGAGGLYGKQKAPDANMRYAGGALGHYLTPTGGAALGGAGTDERVFGGMSMLAMPIGVPIIRGSEADRRVVGIDSAIAGYETSLDSKAEKALVRIMQTQWNPNNPSQTLVAYNYERDVDGKKQMSARYFFIDKKGEIFEIKGGMSDFMKIMNYAAGYGNENFNTPSTYAWNVEPEIERGGSAVAVDIGKSAGLLHYQSVPFFLPEGRPQPLLIQWTPGFANTSDVAGGTMIQRITLPGKVYIPRSGAGAGETYTIQDVTYMVRKIKGRDAWQLDIGAGGADTPIGPQWRGGFFFKSQTPDTKSGGGVFYEAGAMNVEQMALLEEAEDAQRYIESLHRIGMTLYRSERMANRTLVGGLAHVVQQLRHDMESGTKPDATFYRFIGILKGLQNAARLDIARYSQLDVMLAEYEEMSRQIGEDPSRAESLLSAFQQKYAAQLRDIYDDYYLGIQINENFSLEAVLLNREQGNNWEKQKPEEVSGRVLFTWKTGFWRAFAAIPVRGEATIDSTSETTATTAFGVAGTGIGQDLLDGMFLQRAAIDVGLLFARYESLSPTQRQTWTSTGYFVQGAARLFSNVLEDANAYRKLAREFQSYLHYIEMGAISKLPANVRAKLADDSYLSDKLRDKIRTGKDFKITDVEAEVLQGSLYRTWFSERKYQINQSFHGNFRAFAGASGYIFDDREYYDIAAFIETVNKYRAYVIGTKRRLTMVDEQWQPTGEKQDVYGLYAGTDVLFGGWRVGAMAGATDRGDVATAMSLSYRDLTRAISSEVGISGFAHTVYTPEYAAPFIRERERIRAPEIGAMFFFTIGGGGVPQFPTTGFQQPRYPNTGF